MRQATPPASPSSRHQTALPRRHPPSGLPDGAWLETQIQAPVHTVCVGRAFSMAALLLAAGERGHRICLPNSTVMIHQVSVEYPKLVATDMMIRAHETQRIKDQMNALFAVHTQQSTQRILEACERDNYLIAQEAVKFGLADRVDRKIPALSSL